MIAYKKYLLLIFFGREITFARKYEHELLIIKVVTCSTSLPLSVRGFDYLRVCIVRELTRNICFFN